MATFKTTYGNPDWYKKMLHPDVAQTQADKLGISQDQLFKLYADTNTQRRQQGQSGMIDPRWNGAQGIGVGQGGSTTGFQGWSGAQGGGTAEQLIAAPPGGNAILGMYGPMATWQKIAGQQPQQIAPQQPQMPQLAPPQAMPTIPTTPLQPTAQYQPPQQAPNLQIPQGNAATAGALFQPGAGGAGNNPWLLPQAMQQQPVQQFKKGGPVTDTNQVLPLGYYKYPGGGPQTYIDPGFAQYGISGLSDAQARAIGIDPQVARKSTINPAQFGTEAGMNLLGGAALQMPMVYNLPPTSGMNNPKGGVQTGAGGAIIGTSVPQVPQGPWLPVGQQTAGMAAPGALNQGGGQFTGSVFSAVPTPTIGQAAGWTGTQTMPLQAAPPANAAMMPTMQMAQTAQPPAPVALPPMNIAPPPAAPGMPYVPTTVPQASNAWGAGGGPFSGTLQDNPNLSHTVSMLMGFNENPWHPQHPPGSPPPMQAAPQMQAAPMQGGGNTPAAVAAQIALGTRGPAPGPPPAPTTKMASGGPVPGRGNQDTVPALLTPGEYVLPKPQAAEFMSGQPIRRMATGGIVTDDTTDDSEEAPRESRRGSIAAAASAYQASGGGGGSSGGSYQPVSSNAAAQQTNQNLASSLSKMYGGGGPSGFSGLASGAYSGGGGTTVGDVMGGAAVPNAGQTMSLGQAPGIGGVTPGVGSAIGSGLQGIADAFNKYASSIGSWTPQKQAFGQNLPTYKTPQLQQNRTT